MSREQDYLRHPLIESVFSFRGLWDLPSQCGLKIVRRSGVPDVIFISDLYDINTGSTVTEYMIPLLVQIERDFGVDRKAARIIHFVPDSSKYVFRNECFYDVVIDFSSEPPVPDWRELERDTVMGLAEG